MNGHNSNGYGLHSQQQQQQQQAVMNNRKRKEIHKTKTSFSEDDDDNDGGFEVKQIRPNFTVVSPEMCFYCFDVLYSSLFPTSGGKNPPQRPSFTNNA